MQLFSANAALQYLCSFFKAAVGSKAAVARQNVARYCQPGTMKLRTLSWAVWVLALVARQYVALH
jgi:hypothetical protein